MRYGQKGRAEKKDAMKHGHTRLCFLSTALFTAAGALERDLGATSEMKREYILKIE